MLREVLSGALEEVNILQTELTSLTRTAHQMCEWNKSHQGNANRLTVRNLNIKIPDTGREREDERIATIVRAQHWGQQQVPRGCRERRG